VIQLEQELLETQRKAGFPAVLPYDSSSLRQLTPQLSRRQQAVPVKPLLQQLETELSDTEISDISPEDGDKTATVERKVSHHVGFMMSVDLQPFINYLSSLVYEWSLLYS
jgi:neurabin